MGPVDRRSPEAETREVWWSVTELLSVVVPTHNRPDRLETAVRSVLDQTGPPVEVVVVDDGSQAPTAEVLDRLSADPRVVVLRNDVPQGAAAARNRGIDVARGDLVGFCDDDDLWLPGAASAAAEALRPSIGVVYGYHEVSIESTGRLVTFRPPARATPEMMRWLNVPAVPMAVVRRSVVGDELYFDTDLLMSEDWDLWLRCADQAPVVLAPHPFYRYVQHAGFRVTAVTEADLVSHRRFLDKHRSSMTAACVAHYEFALALMAKDAGIARGELAKLPRHPTILAAGALIATEVVASRLGQRRKDPGLRSRVAVGLLGPVIAKG